MKAIINGKIIKENEIIENKVLLFNEKIIDIISKDTMNDILDKNDNLEIIDAEGNYVSPGFIDLHIHGSGGSDVMDGTIEDVETIRTIAGTGVTSFLPTTMTMSKEKIYNALENIRVCKEKKFNGAKVLGAHLEGPFINKVYKGAQSVDYIIEPSYAFIEDYLDTIKIITLAPETDKGLSFVKEVKKNNEDIVLSIGHSNATFEEAVEAIEEGITHATHTFNAMTALNHRKPGIVGAVLSKDVYCELIADKIHVHPGIYNLMINTKGKDKIVLVTDCIRAGCLKCGISELGGQKVIVDETSARLEDGTLAGSILTLNKAVKNFYENSQVSLCDVIGLVSWNPAKDIGIINERGTLDIGKYSDIVIFDEDINIKYTIVEGNIVFQ